MTERLALAARLDALPLLSAWIERFAASHGISPRSAFQLELVLTEAVTNIIEHGHDATGAGDIKIACERRAGELLLEISDAGSPFDPTAHAPHLQPVSLDAASPGGLGVHLMRQYSREMRYLREAGRNHLYLTLAANA
jgi:anti-sigma regulatory factor (Ser/Thr protein kinase)